MPPSDALVTQYKSMEGTEMTPIHELVIQKSDGDAAPNDVHVIVNQPVGFEGMKEETSPTSNDVIVTQPPAGVESMLIDQVTPQGTRVNRPAGTEGLLVENCIQPREDIQTNHNNKSEYINASTCNRHDEIEHSHIGTAETGNGTTLRRIYTRCCNQECCSGVTCSCKKLCPREVMCWIFEDM